MNSSISESLSPKNDFSSSSFLNSPAINQMQKNTNFSPEYFSLKMQYIQLKTDFKKLLSSKDIKNDQIKLICEQSEKIAKLTSKNSLDIQDSIVKTLQQNLDSAVKENADLEIENQRLSSTNAENSVDIANLKSQLQKLEEKNEETQACLDEALALSDEVTHNYDELQSKYDLLQQQLENQAQNHKFNIEKDDNEEEEESYQAHSAEVDAFLRYFDASSLNDIINIFEKNKETLSETVDLKERYESLKFELAEALATSAENQKAKTDLLAKNVSLEKEIERLQTQLKTSISPLSASSNFSGFQNSKISNFSNFSTPSIKNSPKFTNNNNTLSDLNETNEINSYKNENNDSDDSKESQDKNMDNNFELMAENEKLLLDIEDYKNINQEKQREIDELAEKVHLQQKQIEELTKIQLRQTLAISSPINQSKMSVDNKSDLLSTPSPQKANKISAENLVLKEHCSQLEEEMNLLKQDWINEYQKLEKMIKNINSFGIVVNQKLMQIQNRFLSIDHLAKAVIQLIITKNKAEYDHEYGVTFDDLADKLEEIIEEEKIRDDFEITIQKSIIPQISALEKKSNQKHKEFMKILQSYS